MLSQHNAGFTKEAGFEGWGSIKIYIDICLFCVQVCALCLCVYAQKEAGPCAQNPSSHPCFPCASLHGWLPLLSVVKCIKACDRPELRPCLSTNPCCSHHTSSPYLSRTSCPTWFPRWRHKTRIRRAYIRTSLSTHIWVLRRLYQNANVAFFTAADAVQKSVRENSSGQNNRQ